MIKKTVLNATHRALGACMANFGGWDMPIHYGSQIGEHHAVRRDAGMFDVSHMSVIDLHGSGTRGFLRYLLANNIDKLKLPGRALYACMLNADGGVMDDLIVYFLNENSYRLVVNAATSTKDLAWINRHAATFDVEVRACPALAIIAVQGPHARARVMELCPAQTRQAIESLGRFSAVHALGPQGMTLFVARTGYTGEDGFEMVLPEQHAVTLWDLLASSGVRPTGLGARDTLRLEAGMNLYGQDMDERVSPWEAGLGWTVALDEGRHFIGRAALERQKAEGIRYVMAGLVMDVKGVLRSGQKVKTAGGEGRILSGSFSPTLGKAIAFARLPAGNLDDIRVEIRGRDVAVRRVNPPFVRHGKPAEGL